MFRKNRHVFLGSPRLFPVVSTIALLAAAACSAPADSADGEGASQEAELNESKALGMTGVTFLYPMPKSIDFFDDMLGPTSERDRGELLPADLFARRGHPP